MTTRLRILTESTGSVKHSTRQVWPIGKVSPAPENDAIYRSISVDDVADLMRSIREHGVLTTDDDFVSATQKL